MKRYKEQVDALHASDTLKQQIAALPQETSPKRTSKKRRITAIAAIAAALTVVLLAGAVATPMLFSVQKSAEQDIAYYGNESYDSAYGDSDYYEYNAAPEMSAPKSGAYGYASDSANSASKTADTPALPSGRKLIRNADLDVETKTFDAFHDAVYKKTAALQGYVEASDTGAYGSARYERLTLRIPADSLDEFLQSVAELGTVTSQETSVQDVTDRYIDVKSRLAALETEQQTLLDLLKKAEDLTEILEIQDRLAEVRGSLESYKAQLQALDSQIDYSTVTMFVSEVERVTPQNAKGFFAEVKQNLSENLYAIGQGARSFAIWFLSSLPNIALFLLAVGAVVGVVLLIRRRRRRRK